MNIEDFFEMIFGSVVDDSRRISIFTIPGERSKRFSSVESAAEYAASVSHGTHVYHGMGLVAGDPAGRGKAADMCAIGALWCDLDVSGPAHGQSEKLPESKAIGLDFLNSLPIAPTIVVDSGNGLHGYWSLEIPLLFDSQPDRDAASRITKGWHGYICERGRVNGWTIPNLGDITRVLRVPGTLNSKTAPAMPVSVIQSTGEVFGVEQFQQYATQPAACRVAPTYTASACGLSPLERCKMYLDQVPPAIEGVYGGTQTLLACKAIYRFGLSGDEARAAFEHYNSRCVPPWKIEKEIIHKLADAEKSVDAAGERGKLLIDGWAIGDPVGEVAAKAFLESPPAPANDKPAKQTQDDEKFPIDCREVPGLIGDIIDYNLRTAMYPQPELALAGALALMAVITGRKITDANNTRTNIYVLGIAPSGSGKEHARSVNKEILIHASSEGEKMLGPERIGSSAGLVSSVAAQPAILFHIDEFGKMLATMKNAAKSPHLYNIGSVLMQMYSSSKSIWIADAYADLKKTKRIIQPHACVYGTGTPDDFWGSLSKENVEDGLLGRLLTFEGRYVQRKSPEPCGVPGIILDRVRKWLELRTGGDGNLSSVSAPNCLVAETSDEAKARLEEHLDGICFRRERENGSAAAVWSRSGEKTAKLALLFACSRWTGELGTVPVVELNDVERAVKITNWLTRKMLRTTLEHVSENDTESKSKRLLRMISGEMTMSDIARKTQWLRSRERHELINDLIGCGYIAIEQRNTDGRPTTIVKRLEAALK